MSISKRQTIRSASVALLMGLSFLCSGDLSNAGASHRTLVAFHSEEELLRFFRHLPHRYPPPPPPPPAPAMAGAVASAPATDKAAESSITNNQVTGVDEGDIVKLHGDTLVILRRGRLFTVSLAGHGMRPVDSVNAYPPGVDARNDWYDEMLIAGDRIVVVGYSYQRGGTEIDRFHIDRDGRLKFEDAYQLRSNDYYSARNYASRLIGHQLILYSPRYLPYGDSDPTVALPALRRWTGEGENAGFRRIGTAREVYLSPGLPPDQIEAVHTVTNCDLTAEILACKATSVIGPSGRVFYVSSHAVYVWVTVYWGQERQDKHPPSLLYRLPLDGGAPSAIGVRGAPVDQFAFREDARQLNVLVRSEGAGDAMWASEGSSGAVALLHVPLNSFGDGTAEAQRALYRRLPTPKGQNYYAFHNRFVGDYVLYGEGNDWGTPQNYGSVLVVAPVAGGDATELALPHGVDRIEAMGGDAVVIGSDASSVYFTTVTLGRTPMFGDHYTLRGAAQGETRSHGFFFHPEGSDGDGVLGLPISRPATAAWRQLVDSSAAMIFVRRSDGKFSPLGDLGAHGEGIVDDACVASCVDWYGNARPIFIGDRTFALMGYELVEGTVSRDAIVEAGRLNFAPAAQR